MENSAKILLLGKTGTGKSSFINYFLGKDVAKTGYGKPVTQEYFKPYVLEDGRYPIEIFDTKGMEALNADDQLDHIVKAISERNNNENPLNWFHTIFYCVSMANDRFEPYEAQMIKRLQETLSQHIHIILTQSDYATPDQMKRMRSFISQTVEDMENVEIFEVVSVDRTNRKGQKFYKRGKEEISERVFSLFCEDIAYKLSKECASELYWGVRSVINDAFDDIEYWADNNIRAGKIISGAFNDDLDGLSDKLDDCLAEIEVQIDDLSEELSENLNEILQPVAKIYESYYETVTGIDISDEIDLFSDDFFPDMNDMDIMDAMYYALPNMSKYMDSNGDFPSDESFGTMLGMIFGGLGDILFIRKNFQTALKKLRSKLLWNMADEDEIQEHVYESILDYLEPDR